ncbi:MAG TPA: hypothetical protein VFZ22_14180 [Pyrinomonadaceae bacterium]|nr:hypothetical protein [Pyrinomonadaceae bacterium]
MPRLHIALGIGIGLVLSVLVLFLMAHKKSVTDKGEEQVRNALTLRDQAKLHKHYVATASAKRDQHFETLSDLGRASGVVVIGNVESTNTRLVSSERFIVTDYTVKLTEVIKGYLRVGQTITVRKPGGLMNFDDGTSAEVKMAESWPAMNTTSKYVLFLSAKPDFTFSIVGGPQGLLEMKGTVLTHPLSQEGLKQDQKSSQLSSINDVRRNLRNQ